MVAYSIPAHEPACHCHFEGAQCEAGHASGCYHIERVLTRQLESARGQLNSSVTVNICVSLLFSVSLVNFLVGLLIGRCSRRRVSPVVRPTPLVELQPVARTRNGPATPSTLRLTDKS